MVREVIQVVELQQPSCSLVYGESPCAASGPDAGKCFNTRSTCQDAENFVLGSTSLFFTDGSIASRNIEGVTYSIPFLRSVSTIPTMLNFAGASPSMQGLGTRASCSISLVDAPHDDTLADPYIDGRGYNAFSRGTFWTKWLKRNLYKTNMIIKVYEGYAGEALSEMSVRQYFLQKVSWPSETSGVTITGQDILARVEAKNGQAPVASEGVVYEAMDDEQVTFRASNALSSEYSASGTVKIDDELLIYTSITEDPEGNYIQFEGVTRATDGTDAAEHSIDAAIQQCVRYDQQPIYTVLYDLLVTYCGIDAAYLDYANWISELDNALAGYKISRILTEPNSVQSLISQIQEQTLTFIWWDERAALVKLKVVRGLTAYPDVLSDSQNIMSGLTITEKPTERASQVWFHFGRTDPTSGVEDLENYNLYISTDLSSEGDDKYGSKSVRQIFGSWVEDSYIARSVSQRILQRYVDIPRATSFEMDAKDRGYGIGDVFYMDHHLETDEFGERDLTTWMITSYEEVLPSEKVRYTAEDVSSYGRQYYWMDNATPEYDGARIFESAYWGDADGLLSDGTTGAKWN